VAMTDEGLTPETLSVRQQQEIGSDRVQVYKTLL